MLKCLFEQGVESMTFVGLKIATVIQPRRGITQSEFPGTAAKVLDWGKEGMVLEKL